MAAGRLHPTQNAAADAKRSRQAAVQQNHVPVRPCRCQIAPAWPSLGDRPHWRFGGGILGEWGKPPEDRNRRETLAGRLFGIRWGSGEKTRLAPTKGWVFLRLALLAISAAGMCLAGFVWFSGAGTLALRVLAGDVVLVMLVLLVL
jgi:hypothetical protein